MLYGQANSCGIAIVEWKLALFMGKVHGELRWGEEAGNKPR